jgi:hypothetical protein
MLSDEQLNRWQRLKHKLREDSQRMNHFNKRDERRHQVKSDILDLWQQFQSHTIDIEKFREVFDTKTRTDWDVFGLKGMSGAMFLNKLVKYLSETTDVANQLRTVLVCPETVNDGYQAMREFQAFLDDTIENGIATRRQIQPARLSFLLSAFWHMQDIENWPVYYVSARDVLKLENLFQPAADPTEDYFQFRTIYRNMMQTLDLTCWEFEHLCIYYQEQQIATTPPVDDVAVVEAEAASKLTVDEETNESKFSHQMIQLMLAQIGQQFGYNVWIAANDQNRDARGERLGDYSIAQLPVFNGVGPKSQRMIELIDVLWLKGERRIVAAFEVESTTSIYSGLLRMADLNFALDNITFPIYIVVPEERTRHVQEQLSRLTFQRLELHTICRFFTFETLHAEADAIMRYASDVKAIDRISQRVDDISEEGYY